MIWSCLPVSIFSEIISGRMSIGEWAAAAKEMGMDMSDISILFVPQRTPKALAEIRRQLREADMGIAMMTTYPDFTQPDALMREREIAHAISDIAVAAELGAKFIRLTAGQVHDELTDDDGVKQVADAFARCCEFAGRWGVRLLIENHSKPGAWDNPDFDFNTERFLKLAAALKGLPVGINFDTANTYALGDDALATFEAVYDQVESIHINDIADCANLRFVGIGDGTAPVSEILCAARRRGFDGLLSIEEVGQEGLTGIRRSFEVSKALWEAAE